MGKKKKKKAKMQKMEKKKKKILVVPKSRGFSWGDIQLIPRNQSLRHWVQSAQLEHTA